jgi:hypothetical protein
MEEKLLKEMISLLHDIREKLTITPGAGVRGPIADPGPDFFHHGHMYRHLPLPIGYNVDPSPEFYFGKEELAKIKVRELDIMINQIVEQVELLKMQRDMMKQEYKIK